MSNNIKNSKTESKTQKKGKKKSGYFRKSLKFTFIVSIILFFAISGILAGTLIGFIQTSDAISPEDMSLKGFTTHLFDQDGKLITPLHGDKNREMVDVNLVPEHMKNAFIAIEDKRFYEHPGIDFRRTLSAGIGFLKSQESSHGGSTITQQVVRNLTNDFERTIRRKVQEQWRAVELERHLTKDQILEIYLNIIFMGNNCYGVQSASKLYFNKDVSDLSLAESAIIAGITNAPSLYNPFSANGKESIKKRQEIILREMFDLGFVSQKEYEEAKEEELQYGSPKTNLNENALIHPYFIDQVVLDIQRDLISNGYSADLASKMIYNNGLKIYTTMDPRVQKAMDEVFSNESHFPMVQQNKEPKAAMVVLDAKSGQVKAMYGGAGPKKIAMGFNYAVNMQRQPGSTFKPIAVYGPAIDMKKITPASVFDDVPVYLDPLTDEKYPTNYDHTYRGLVSAREALKYSLNTIAAKVWTIDSGFSRSSLSYLSKVGIHRQEEDYISTALGGLEIGVSPLQMAGAYVPFANKGLYYKPITYTKVLDAKGKVLLENIPEPQFVYDDTTAHLITDMLKDAVSPGGTGYPYGLIQNGQMPSAGKTGTTSDNYDKWFVGYSPYYVGATWYGYDKNISLLPSEYNKALFLWNQVMETAHQGLPVKPFDASSGIVLKTIDKYTGLLPGPLSALDPRGNAILEERFIRGTEPKESDVSYIHEMALVCVDSQDAFGRYPLATAFCPASSLREMVFIKRNPPYIPKKEGDPYPKDFIYELPTEFCTVHNPPPDEKGELVEEKAPTKNPTTQNATEKKEPLPSEKQNGTKPQNPTSPGTLLEDEFVIP
jgi:penicillin-binding protein 1A